MIVRRLRPLLGLLLLCLSGCSFGGPPPRPAFDTMEEALAGPLGAPVELAYQEPFGPGRAMVLFRLGPETLSATIMEQTRNGRQWRMTDSVGIHTPVRIGALSHARANLGWVETKVGQSTHVTAEAHVIYGEVLDPAITWVELTLDEPGAQPIRTQVKNGIWSVIVPPGKQMTWFQLRAGDGRGERFAARLGMQRAAGTTLDYRDEQAGIRFAYPEMGTYVRMDQAERLLITYSLVEVAIERRPNEGGAPEERLIAWLPETSEVLEHETTTLGGHPAGYVLEKRPEERAERFTYLMRYLIPTEGTEYEVTCTTKGIQQRTVWESGWRPVCESLLTTLQLGGA